MIPPTCIALIEMFETRSRNSVDNIVRTGNIAPLKLEANRVNNDSHKNEPGYERKAEYFPEPEQGHCFGIDSAQADSPHYILLCLFKLADQNPHCGSSYFESYESGQPCPAYATGTCGLGHYCPLVHTLESCLFCGVASIRRCKKPNEDGTIWPACADGRTCTACLSTPHGLLPSGMATEHTMTDLDTSEYYLLKDRIGSHRIGDEDTPEGCIVGRPLTLRRLVMGIRLTCYTRVTREALVPYMLSSTGFYNQSLRMNCIMLMVHSRSSSHAQPQKTHRLYFAMPWILVDTRMCVSV